MATPDPSPGTAPAPLVAVRGVTKTYQRGPERVAVLHGIDLDIAPGEFIALMGPSGSGKSTLLNLIGGLDTPTSGAVAIEGQRIDRMSEAQLATWRSRHVGFVFQFYNLMPTLTAHTELVSGSASAPMSEESSGWEPSAAVDWRLSPGSAPAAQLRA